jgi:hypothetical protein
MLPALRLRYHTDVSFDQPSQPAVDAPPTYPPVLTPPPPPPPPSAPPPDPLITHTGWKMLLASAFGPPMGNFAIVANPLLLCGWVMLAIRRYRTAAIVCGVATLFALETFQLRWSGMYEDESGSNISYLTHPLLGWYLWLGAILLPLAAAIYLQRKSAALAASEVPVASR